MTLAESEREREEALATAIVDYHIPQPQRKFPIPYYKALSFSIECRPQHLRQRERGSELGACL